MIAAGDKKKLIRLTNGNIRNANIPVTGLRGLLPGDCFGSPKKAGGVGKAVTICLAGLNKTIETDIGRDAKTGEPRRQFRVRGWVKRFFQHHRAKAGDVLEIERVGEREYQLRVVSNGEDVPTHPSSVFRVAEFFAGIGLVRLALEGRGLKVVFANDIDPDKLQIYKDNFPTNDLRLGDIHMLGQEDIPDCDLATGSFPCTDLSIAGAMKGIHSGESSAFWAIARLLCEMHLCLRPVRPIDNAGDTCDRYPLSSGTA